jgi:hypothetical protein
LPDKSLLSLLLKYMGCFSSEWISVLHARAAKKTNSQFGLSTAIRRDLVEGLLSCEEAQL